MNKIYTKPAQKDLPPVSSNTEWIGDALLNIAAMYCKVGNYQQAIDWCHTFLLTNQKNDQLISILTDIIRQARSFGVKKQAARLLDV